MPLKNKHLKNALARIFLAILLTVLGCVVPLLIIHYKKPYQHWQPLTMEIIGLAGLSLLFGQLLLKK